MSEQASRGKAPGGLFSEVRRDLPAGLVVFLVAVPLCLGIAQASSAPLLSGLIAGIIGGLLVSALSKSELSVSGPAAGLAVIVATGIAQLGFRTFLLAVVLGGVIQLLLGLLRLGSIAHFFPNAVIKGMLASIGVLITLKQLPHAVGYDADWEGDDAFFGPDGHNTFTAIVDAFGALSPTATAITLLCFTAYLVWPKLQRGPLNFVPPALVVVVMGGLLAALAPMLSAELALSADHLVSLPVLAGPGDLLDAVQTPEFAALSNPAVWTTAVTLAIVASIETLLSLEAVDRLDPHRRISPPNRELVAQGVGNVVSGMVGGLPVTSVIVRSSANVAAGGETRLSAMVHGLLLFLGVVFFAAILNQIPLAALAVVLIFVGFKLTPPSLWKAMWKAGYAQFIPFASTVAAVVVTDLLKGTLFGLLVGVVFAIREQQRGAIVVVKDSTRTLIRITKDLTFLNKASLKEILSEIEDGATVVIDRRVVDFVDDDIEEILLDFEDNAEERGIRVQMQLSPRDLERRAALEATHVQVDDDPDEPPAANRGHDAAGRPLAAESPA
ncbi:MAG: SulP family inorganic anion transporter [Deltaproteobacteria bacterium]|nr:SulP family inorganic anion transporter [Deltaproteobacteria bacterium]